MDKRGLVISLGFERSDEQIKRTVRDIYFFLTLLGQTLNPITFKLAGRMHHFKSFFLNNRKKDCLILSRWTYTRIKLQ